MDYSRLLFAVEVRKLTLERVNDSIPDGLTGDERLRYIRDKFKEVLPATVREFEGVAAMIDAAHETNAN